MEEETKSQEVFEIVYKHYYQLENGKQLSAEDPLVIRRYSSPFWKDRDEMRQCYADNMVRALAECLNCEDLECRHWYRDEETNKICRECEEW